MGRRLLAVAVLLLLLAPPAQAEEWRENEVDPEAWTDGPELEGSPMDASYPGDPVLVIDVNYQPGHLANRVTGSIVIELFPQWAPITVENMIEHVEDGLYDGIFFHRVIDDFVTQAGDPTCTTIGVYPATSPSCASGGTGETIPLEHHENLSHVDGAIGMARSADPDSADAQWYIAETEAHGLDPENRDDEGYATFGVVRDGMSHVRAIAEVPTSDDPTGTDLQNPFSSMGRPLYEVRIERMAMLGVIPAAENDSVEAQGLSAAQVALRISGAVVLLAAVGAAFVVSRTEEPAKLDTEEVYEAVLVAEQVES